MPNLLTSSMPNQACLIVSDMGDISGTLGDRLRQALAKANKKPAHLAAACEVSAASVSDWLSGETKNLKGPNLYSAARFLDVNAEWLATGEGPMSALELAEPKPWPSETGFAIPQLDVAGGMALVGREMADHLDIVNQVRVNLPQLRREISFSSPTNLRIITGYGDSMEPTFRDGDPLLVDTGVTEIHVDGVYVLEREGELFIKRVQRHPIDKTLIVSSDNRIYQPYVISDAERVRFRISGRVLLAWNGRKL